MVKFNKDQWVVDQTLGIQENSVFLYYSFQLVRVFRADVNASLQGVEVGVFKSSAGLYSSFPPEFFIVEYLALVRAALHVIGPKHILLGNIPQNIAHQHKTNFLLSLRINNLIKPIYLNYQGLRIILEMFVICLDSIQ